MAIAGPEKPYFRLRRLLDGKAAAVAKAAEPWVASGCDRPPRHAGIPGIILAGGTACALCCAASGLPPRTEPEKGSLGPPVAPASTTAEWQRESDFLSCCALGMAVYAQKQNGRVF